MGKHLLLLLLLVAQTGFSQAVFTGNVMISKRQPAKGATVTISQPNSTNILAFTTTSEAGFYSISYSNLADSLQLNISALGFATQRKTVRNVSQENDFQLVESSIELNEVVVRLKPAVTRRGDTLTFDADRFRGKNDRDVADLLRRIPGIEIEASGRILYKGFPINKYYIEGIDLLGGGYNLANENLPADVVENIEVIENHQPTKVLKDFEISDDAAINIKLKDGTVFTGKALAGAGASPLLWEANVTPMLFTKQNQFVGTYQSNNTGNDLTRQTRNLIRGDVRNSFEEKQSKKDWVSIQQLASPPFEDTRWLDNNSHLIAINQLSKLRNEYELRLNVDYISDYQQQNGSTKMLFYTPLDTVRFTENKYNQLYSDVLKSGLTIEQNKKSSFFKNETKFQGFWNNQLGNIIRNDEEVNQILNNPYFSVSNRLRKIFTVKTQLITFDSDVRYTRTPQSLTVSPGQFEDLINTGISYDSLRQNVGVNFLQINNSVAFSKNIKRFTLSPVAGFSFERQELQTTLNTLLKSVEKTLPNQFSNDQTWTQNQYFIKLKTGYRYNGGRIELQTPLTFYDISVMDKIAGDGQSKKRLAFEPDFLFVYEFADFWRGSLKYSREVDLGNREDIHYGYILRNYRNIERRDVELPTNISNRFFAGVNYGNSIKAVKTYFNFTQVYTLNNLLFSNKLDADGNIELTVIEQRNRSTMQQISTGFSKFYSNSRSTVSARIKVLKQSREQLINDKLTNVSTLVISPSIYSDFNINRWFGFYYSYSPTILENNIDQLKGQLSTQHAQTLALKFNPTEQVYFDIRNEYYVNRFINQNSENLFTDLTFRYTFTKSKVDLEANWNNVFNIKTLTTVSASSFAYSESTYQLRLSQVLVKVRFSFK